MSSSVDSRPGYRVLSVEHRSMLELETYFFDLDYQNVNAFDHERTFMINSR